MGGERWGYGDAVPQKILPRWVFVVFGNILMGRVFWELFVWGRQGGMK